MNEQIDKEFSYSWDTDRWLLHLVVGHSSQKNSLEIVRLHGDEEISESEDLFADSEKRFIITRESPQESGIKIRHKSNLDLLVYEILDRAHYPCDPIYDNKK